MFFLIAVRPGRLGTLTHLRRLARIAVLTGRLNSTAFRRPSPAMGPEGGQAQVSWSLLHPVGIAP